MRLLLHFFEMGHLLPTVFGYLLDALLL